jgi:3-keto-disaccharide hydrolase
VVSGEWDRQGESIMCHRRYLWPIIAACFLVLPFALAAPPPVSWAGDPSKAAAGKSDEKAGWKKLFDGKSLDGWKSADFFGPGKVHVKDGAIVMEKGQTMTGVTYSRKDFPKIDYEVRLEGKKIAGNDFFCTTTFPVGDSFCSLVVGGWGGGTVGLSSINGADASENETHQSKEFKKDQWYHVRIRVSKQRIEAWIDDDKLVDLDTKDRKISTRIECEPCQPFGVATWKTVGAVRNLRVRKLTDEDKKQIGEKKPEKEN